MKAPPKSVFVDDKTWSNMGTLFHSMLLASQEYDIPLFNQYFLPNNYSKLLGMTDDVGNRWGYRPLSDIMSKQKINESFHNIFGCRTIGKSGEIEKNLEGLGYDYMAHLQEFGGTNDTIFHQYNHGQSLKTVKSMNWETNPVITDNEEHTESMSYAQTLLYTWFTQFNNCSQEYNHMFLAMKHYENVNYLYEYHESEDRLLAEENYIVGHHTDFMTALTFDNNKSMEINPWRIVPLRNQADFVSQYFTSEMVNTDHDSYTPYWTTIDYTSEANTLGNRFNLNQDIKTIISDPNVFPITISKTHFLFCHRLLGFFCLRSLPVTPHCLSKDPKAESVNFRKIIYEINDQTASKHHILFSAYEDVSTSGLMGSSYSRPRGKRIYDLNHIEYEKIVLERLIPSYNLSGKTMDFECRNLASTWSGGSASRRHYARRLKSFYGFCVGMATVTKEKPYSLPSGSHGIADAIIYSFNKEISMEKDLYETEMRSGAYVSRSGVTKAVLFHGPLRSVYKAETMPMTWAEIVNEGKGIEVPPPTHVSEFIPSWKDLRKPVTVNVSGAPPIGFYHKERRCKVCNGRVILTTPAHCKVETVQCPHCKHGKIEVNE